MNIQNPFKFVQKNASWAFTLILLLTAFSGSTQSIEAGTDTILIVVSIVSVMCVFVLLVAIYTLQVLNKLVASQRAKEGQFESEPSMWSRFLEMANNRVSEEKEGDILLDHDFDGIRELDNHLPPWWKWLFYSTIIWGAVYLVGHHFTGWFPLQEEEYTTEVEEANLFKLAMQQSNGEDSDFDLSKLVYVEDEKILAAGQKLFNRNCIACHTESGGGNAIGPNLTDEYWLHGGSIKDIFTTIKVGVPDKGMISWEAQLSPTDIRDVSSYILSLGGTNPPNAKEAQGKLYVPVVEADSTVSEAAVIEEAAIE